MALIEGFGILLRVLYPATPHIARRCGGAWATLAPGRSAGRRLAQVDAGALVQDELEPDAAGGRQAARRDPRAASADKAAIEAAALASPTSRNLPKARRKKVIVVPGRLVNVVV